MTKLPIKHSKQTGRPEQSEAERQTRLVITAIKDNKLRVIVKPNSSRTEILEYNKDKQAVVIAVKAPADKNKANLELIKFLSKQLKRKVRIKSGLTSKEKVISVV